MSDWRPEYSVGIAKIDDQHKSLFRLLGELSVAIIQINQNDIKYILNTLENYMLYHFSSEEHLMDKYDYPDLEEHKNEHEEFKARVNNFKKTSLRKDLW